MNIPPAPNLLIGLWIGIHNYNRNLIYVGASGSTIMSSTIVMCSQTSHLKNSWLKLWELDCPILVVECLTVQKEWDWQIIRASNGLLWKVIFMWLWSPLLIRLIHPDSSAAWRKTLSSSLHPLWVSNLYIEMVRLTKKRFWIA